MDWLAVPAGGGGVDPAAGLGSADGLAPPAPGRLGEALPAVVREVQGILVLAGREVALEVRETVARDKVERAKLEVREQGKRVLLVLDKRVLHQQGLTPEVLIIPQVI